MSSIILLGIKHCGKSTQGKLLSKHFNCPFYDTDDEIEQLTGKTPREIYTEDGKEAFLEAERKACKNLTKKLSTTESDNVQAVIATGGGICNNPQALESLHTIGKFVFLNADENTAVSRIIREIKYDSDGSMSNLPAYIAKEHPKNVRDVRAIFHTFYEERHKIYQDLCDIEVTLVQTASKSENTKKILSELNLAEED